MNEKHFYDIRNIRVKGVPTKILTKAIPIIRGLERGDSIQVYRGKRLQNNRNVFSIPIGFKWRLVGRFAPNLQITDLCSHEKYNGLV
jgi:hypothetical protein